MNFLLFFFSLSAFDLKVREFRALESSLFCCFVDNRTLLQVISVDQGAQNAGVRVWGVGGGGGERD